MLVFILSVALGLEDGHIPTSNLMASTVLTINSSQPLIMHIPSKKATRHSGSHSLFGAWGLFFYQGGAIDRFVVWPFFSSLGLFLQVLGIFLGIFGLPLEVWGNSFTYLRGPDNTFNT